MTIEAVKEAVLRMSGDERSAFAEWFYTLHNDEWDRQMEEDFSPGGRAAHWVEEVQREILAGETTSLEEGLALRRRQRASK